MQKLADYYDNLGLYVKKMFDKSRNEYQAVFNDIVACQKRIKGECFINDQYANDAHWPIIPSVLKNVWSVLVDIYGPRQDVPFKLRPSPLPDLPNDVEADLTQRFTQNISAVVQEYGEDPSSIAGAYKNLRRTMKDVVENQAIDAANELEDVIQDRMRIGGWDRAFSDFLFNFLAFPVAIMYGPVLTPKINRRWSDETNSLMFETTDTWVVENIDPLNFYISPLATDVQSAEYVIQVRRATSSDMMDLTVSADYDADAIKRLLADFPDGYQETYYNRSVIPPMMDTREALAGVEFATGSGVYDILCFYGRIPGYILEEYDSTIDSNVWYECEIYTCAERVIKVIVDPNLDKRRPFEVACMEPVPNNFYGNCIPTRLEDVERVAEAAVRNLVKNMSYASGPMGEVVLNKLDNAEREEYNRIEPYTIKAVKAMPGDASPAYKFYSIDSYMSELMSLQESCLQWAYQIIGIQPLSAGTTPLTGVGTVGRSATGMSIQLAQTSKTIKNMVYRVSRDIIKPIVQSYVDLELINNIDPTIRGDVNVEVIGIEGLDDDANKVVRLNQTLQSFVGYAQTAQQLQGSPFAGVFMTLVRKILTMEGVDVSTLPDFSLVSDLNSDMGNSMAGLSMNGQNTQIPQQPVSNMSLPLQNMNQANNMINSGGSNGTVG